MRDITQDLQDRLSALDSERDRLHKRIADLEEQRCMLTALLQQECRRWSTCPEELPVNGHMPLELSEIIRDVISSGEPWNGRHIAAIAAQKGYQFGSSKPGRVVHSTLIGMSRNGLVENVGTGKWKLKSPKKGALELRNDL